MLSRGIILFVEHIGIVEFHNTIDSKWLVFTVDSLFAEWELPGAGDPFGTRCAPTGSTLPGPHYR